MLWPIFAPGTTSSRSLPSTSPGKNERDIRRGYLTAGSASSGPGRFIAEQGDDVIITNRNPKRAQEVAAEIGGTTRGLAVMLDNRPQSAPPLPASTRCTTW
jgi:hypothetical protein